MSALERLRTLLARDFGLEPGRLREDATLEELEIDSLRLIEIAFCVEEEFGIALPQDQAAMRARVKTLGDLAAWIDEAARAPGT